MSTRRRIALGLVALSIAVFALVMGLTQPQNDNTPTTPSSPIAGSYDEPASGMPNEYQFADSRAQLDESDVRTVNTPVFNCSVNDGRPRATYGDVDGLTPCWNQVVHVMIDKDGAPSLAKYTNVIGGHSVQTVLDQASYNQRENTGENHYKFTVITEPKSTYEFDIQHLNGDLINNPRFADHVIYYRVDNGTWQIKTGNLFEGLRFSEGKKMEIVVVIYDEQAPKTIAPVPFDWGKMAKGLRFAHFTDK